MANRQEIHDKHPDSWVPINPGDVLIGKVADVVDAWSDKRNNLKGGFYPLISVGDIEQATPDYDLKETPLLKVHCFGTVLFNEAMRKQPEVGERVRFLYRGLGEDKKGTGNPPELYTITVAGRADAGKRAYGSIAASEQPGPAATPAAVTSPVEPEQQTLSDDDIPF